ncbi:MAG TPA: cytidylate kinase-like family protein [Anaerovoracaceae bacterium]|nr:cytidylate kinase-like family protein [Anaerovoracaceae bacterium]
MSGQIIMTISTQPGCGGVEIGQRLAARTVAAYVDKKAVAKASLGLDAILKDSNDAKSKGKFWELLGKTPILEHMEFYIPEMSSVVSDAPVHEREEEILLELVGDKTSVVVGRGGFYRFRDYPNLVRIFIGGDWNYRLENYMRVYNLGKMDAKDLLHTTDRATERYIRKVTGKDMLDIRNYDLSFNVSRIDFDLVVKFVAEYIHHRFGHIF